MTVGFDFGTTNCLVSAATVKGIRKFVDDDGLPFPSVITYDGDNFIVGQQARRTLEAAGLGIHGATVRSPKFLLGRTSVHVGGRDRSPIDIVRDVVQKVKDDANEKDRDKILSGLREAVVTIPISMSGHRRRELREAFGGAGISITQFVHEPFAALYGFLRNSTSESAFDRNFDRKLILVVDWGGGTLDVTLCRFDGADVLQLANSGDAEVGGDFFDEAIRDELINRSIRNQSIPDGLQPDTDIRLLLLSLAEQGKRILSEGGSHTFYRKLAFGSKDLNVPFSTVDLETTTNQLVERGMDSIVSLLHSVHLEPSQVSFCLAVGGMVAMPSIRRRLHETFGVHRVLVPENSASLISEGAAMISRDKARLRLVRPVEIRLARGSYLTLLRRGTEMPPSGEIAAFSQSLYCCDPSEGFATVQICTPRHLSESQARTDPRIDLETLSLKVDPRAGLFTERISLNSAIDSDLVLRVEAKSLDLKDQVSAEITDLEFGIRIPGSKIAVESDDTDDSLTQTEQPETNGRITARSNIATSPDRSLVPGEILYQHDKRAFDPSISGSGRATEKQRREFLYYQPCAICGRSSSDPNCTCSSRAPEA